VLPSCPATSSIAATIAFFRPASSSISRNSRSAIEAATVPAHVLKSLAVKSSPLISRR
jgi:hypothetical protein